MEYYGSNDFRDYKGLYLEHYGILGMKWGIRRYQNADGSYTAAGRKRYGIDGEKDKSEVRKTIVKKGSEVYRTTNREEEHTGHAYVTINKKDAEAYEGWGNLHATYKALEDINIPTDDVAIKEACKLIRDDPDVRMAVAKAQIGFTNKTYKKLAESSLEKIGKKPYNTFVGMLDENEVVRDKYFSKLMDEGYNAVKDVMDEGFMSEMPLIIFDRSKTLSYAKYREK